MLLHKSDRKLPDFLLVPQYSRLKILSKKLLDVLLHKPGALFLDTFTQYAFYKEKLLNYSLNG